MCRNMPRVSSFIMITALIGLTAASVLAAQKKPNQDAAGGHPLAGRSGSLAELLEMPDWQADGERPVAEPWTGWDVSEPAPDEQAAAGRVPMNPRPLVKPAFPAVPAVPPDQAIAQLIAERNRIIDGCRLFDTMVDIYREEAVMQQKLVALQAENAALKAAIDGQTQVYALGKAGQPQRAAADARVRNAQGRLRDADAAVGKQRGVLQPLYERIQPNLGPWLQTYVKMRRFLKPDRQDPNRPAVLAALERGIAGRGDFYEGRVLAALAWAYEGDAAAAEAHLAEACQGYARLRLFFSLLGPDCCHAYLLLDKPEMVKDWVATIRKMQAVKKQTPLLCWLVADALFQEHKDNDAKTFFERALTKAGVFKQKAGGPLPEPLLGDAAFFYATTDNQKLRDLDKARQLLDKAPEQSESWQVLRARAAVLFAEGKDAEAEKALDACRERAPKVIEERLNQLRPQAASLPTQRSLAVGQ
jgi:tetratricopeptide (TPR) repeat protein